MIATTVLYHGGCLDGFGSALATWMKHGNEAQYIPVTYGQAPPKVPAEHSVMIVDFSYPYEMMKKLIAEHAYVVLLDHHLGSEEDAKRLMGENHSNFTCYHDTFEYGATLTWEYMWGPKGVPLLYRYLRDGDLWTWELPGSREVYAALASHQRTFETWEVYVNQGPAGVKMLEEQGVHIRRAESKLVQQMVHSTLRMVKLGQYEVPAVNAPILWSEAAHEAMLAIPGAKFGAYYHTLANGKIKWGMRGEGYVDLNALAKHWGGGGHFNAASFTVEEGAIAFI